MATASAQIKVYPDAEMTAQDFAMLIERLSTEASGIIYGCGVNKKPDSNNTLVVASGWCLVRGRLIYITTGDVTVTLPSSGSTTQYVYVEVNLGDSATPAKISVGPSLPVDNELFNQNSSYSYLELCRFTLSNTGVSNLKNTELMNRPPKRNNTISKMITKVVNPQTAATERELITWAEVGDALGITVDEVIAMNHVFVSVLNGHWEANGCKMTGVSYRQTKKAWYVHFASSHVGQTRYNILVTYTPDLL